MLLEPLEERTLFSVYTVDRLTDVATGTGLTGDLRYCITQANSSPGADTITLAVTGTITLTSALPELNTNLTIQGPGAANLTVQRSTAVGTPNFSIFYVSSGATVGLSGLTIASGSTPDDEDEGGGIYNDSGTVTVSNITLSGNEAEYGGGIYNKFGTLTVSNSTLAGNEADYGGGIYNIFGTVTVSSSTLSGNATYGADGVGLGGGIYNDSGTVTVSNSTLANNTAYPGGVGGGIVNYGRLTVSNSTLSGNTAALGGGIYSDFGSTLTVSNSTFSGNAAGFGGGIVNYGTLQARNTLVAGNTAPTSPDLYGDLGSQGHNLIGNASGGGGFHATDLRNVNPLLGPLQNNGGPTLTRALLPGSPALDAGDNASAPPWDQRGPGFPRIVNNTIDIGAYEGQLPAAAGSLQFSAATYSVVENGGSATITVSRTGGIAGTVSVTYATSNGSASAGQDYTAASGTLTFLNGEVSKTFTVPILEDTQVEGNEMLTLTLSNPTGGATLGTPNTAVLTIVDNDMAQPGSLQFSAATYSVTENGGSATITVSRSGGSDGTVSITYASSNGSATAGQDYTVASGTLTFLNGDVSKTFTVAILDDTLVEGNETVTLTLSGPTGGATLGTPSTAVLTIVDNDTATAARRYDFGTATSPVAAGYTQVTPATTYTAAQGYGWQSGTILAVDRGTGTDLTRDLNFATAGTFAVALANGTYTVILTVGDLGHLHDLMQISLEGGVVDTLSTAAGQVLTKSYTVSVSDGQLTLRLQDQGGSDPNVVIQGLEIGNDAVSPGSLQFSSASYSVVENGGSASITVSRSGGSAGTVSVNYATSNGSASAGQDYTFTSGTLAFNNGEVSKTFTIPILDDSQVEGNETVTLTLSSPTGGATLGTPSTAVLTIVDNDAAAAAKRFDFGTATSPVAAGYTQVTPATTYSVTQGYGWQSGSMLAVDRGTGTDLTRDLNYAPSGTFAVDLANGTYTVTLTVGDLGHLHDLMQISLEGGVVDTLSTAAGQVLTKSYTVSVADGQLTLRLQDLGGSDPNTVLIGLDIGNGTPPPGSPPGMVAIGTPGEEAVAPGVVAAAPEGLAPGTGAAGVDPSSQLRPEVVDVVFASPRRRLLALRPVLELADNLLDDTFAF